MFQRTPENTSELVMKIEFNIREKIGNPMFDSFTTNIKNGDETLEVAIPSFVSTNMIAPLVELLTFRYLLKATNNFIGETYNIEQKLQRETIC